MQQHVRVKICLWLGHMDCPAGRLCFINWRRSRTLHSGS